MPLQTSWRKIKYRTKRRLGRHEKYGIEHKNGAVLGEGFESINFPVRVRSRTRLLGKDFDAVLKKMKLIQFVDVDYPPKALALPPRQKIINARRAWKALKDAGLPVPSFFTPIIRRGALINGHGILMENLEKKYGKIIPINAKQSPKPIFLIGLNVKEHGPLIRNLARDFATIINKGFFPHAADFWAFYHKPGTSELDRIILDLTLFTHIDSAADKKEHAEIKFTHGVRCFSDIKDCLGKEEFVEFAKTFLGELKDNELRSMIYSVFLPKK